MRIRWGVSVAFGVVGIACSSFNGDGSSGPGVGPIDAGADVVVTGVSGDDSLEITPPPARTYVLQGQSQSVVFNVKRGANVQGAISFELENLPAGVTATNTTLPEAGTSLGVQLTADATADHKLSQVKVTATTIAGDGTAIRATAQHEVFLRGPSGAIDTTFGTGGKLVVDSTGFDDVPLLVVGPKDEIYTRPGTASACPGGGTGAVTCLFRYTADGVVDKAFGPGGSGQVSPVPTTFAGVVQPDRRFVGVGNGATHSLVYRLNSDGTADNTFGNASEGAGTLGVNGAGAVALGNDGSLAVAGVYYASSFPHVAIQRMNAKGAFLEDFGLGGLATWDPNNTLIRTPSIAIKKNGHVAMAAVCGQTSLASYEAQELDTLGVVVPTFGTNGALHGDYRNYDDIQQFYGTVAYPDGSLLFPISKRIVKINAAGQFDPTFGTAGAGYVDFDGNSYAVAGTPDGKIVVYTKPDGVGTAPSVVRLDASGAFDMSFGTNGSALIDATLHQAGRASVQSDGRILVMSSQTIIRVWN